MCVLPYGNAFEGLEFCHFSKSSDVGRWLFNSHCCAQVLVFRDKKSPNNAQNDTNWADY